MEAIARMRNVPMSPRKMRLVINNIRGRNVTEALGILKYTKNEASRWLEKALMSAIANWEVKTNGAHDPDAYDLYVSKIFSDGGFMLKRFQPAPQGRAHRILKRTAHVTLVIQNRKEIETTTNAE